MPLSEVVREVWRTWSGKFSIILLIIMGVGAIAVVLGTPYTKLSREYLLEPTAWATYPKAVPPCWAVPKKAQVIRVEVNTSHVKPVVRVKSYGPYTMYNVTWRYSFTYKGQAPPSDTLAKMVVYKSKKLLAYRLYVMLVRPDGSVLHFAKELPVVKPVTVILGLPSAQGITWVSLSSLPINSAVYQSLVASLSKYMKKDVLAQLGLGTAIWCGRGGRVLRGRYTLVVTAVFYVQGKARNLASLTHIYFAAKTLPNCYGLMGTDSVGRPVELGILLGLPWSFVISFYVTFLSAIIGGVYGVLAGYVSGWKSEALMRIVDVVNSLPFLPILIVAIMALKSYSIWLIMSIMVALLWAPPVIVIRSMALQIKEQPYVEAARALGASTPRILLRYIMPQVFPYLVAIMVLSIPDAIIAEAALAFLGLSDPTVPTWGKMLEFAWNEHAVINGWWWSFLFPGLALTVYCAAFLMLGRALEPIVSPRIRGR